MRTTTRLSAVTLVVMTGGQLCLVGAQSVAPTTRTRQMTASLHFNCASTALTNAWETAAKVVPSHFTPMSPNGSLSSNVMKRTATSQRPTPKPVLRKLFLISTKSKHVIQVREASNLTYKMPNLPLRTLMSGWVPLPSQWQVTRQMSQIWYLPCVRPIVGPSHLLVIDLI